MKKVLVFILIAQAAAVFLFPVSGGDRNRFFLIAGAGHASSQPGGPLSETGVEVRLFGNIHARLSWDHYFGDDSRKGSETLWHMNSITLCVLYNMQLSERLDFKVKLGGNFTTARSEITALGITFNTTKANVGFAGGLGFSLQLGNNMYFYVESTVKYVLFEEPWAWAEIQTGLMFRLR